MDGEPDARDQPFRWRAELPWIALTALVGALARIPIVRASVETTHGDTAIVWLMMRRIATGEDFPLLYYGQGYMGSVDPFMAVPFYWLMGPRYETLGVAQVVIFCLIAVPLVYRLLHMIGGRRGAVIGSVLVAFATPWMLICTAGRYTGYLSTFWIGALMLLIGLREIREGPCRKRAVALGLLVGLGWYNNPQIALFVAPLMLALWLARGRIPALRAEGQLAAVMGRRRLRVGGWAFSLGVMACVFFVFLCFVQEHAVEKVKRGAKAEDIVIHANLGPLHISMGTPRNCFVYLGDAEDAKDDDHPKLKFGSPENYIPRVIVLLVLMVMFGEYLCARDRKAWFRWLCVFGAAAVVGFTPMIVAKVKGTTGRSAPLDINPAWIPKRMGFTDYARFPGELRFADLVWFGSGKEERDTMPPAWLRGRGEVPADDALAPILVRVTPKLRWATISLWAVLLVAYVLTRWRVIWTALRVRTVELKLLDLLVLQQTMLTLLFLQHPLWASGRYWIYGWLMLGGLVAWSVSLLWARARGVVVAGCVLLALHYGLTYAVFVGYRLNDGRRLPADEMLVPELERRGLSRGVADYELVYHLIYRSDEQKILVCKREINERLPANWESNTRWGGRYFRMTTEWAPCDVVCTDGFALPVFLARQGAELTRRWKLGNYVFYEYEKRAGSSPDGR